MIARFGPAGTAESFKAMGYKKPIQLPDYLQTFGLTAFEYQCGRGVRVNIDTITTLGTLCRDADIQLSLHAPYFISLSSVEEEKRLGSVNYIIQSAEAATVMGADRIIVHSGSCSKITREEATALALDTLKMAQQALDDRGLSHIHICPETMGKINQLGTLDEVITLCGVDERFIPCVDFGHLNARTLGGMNDKQAFEQALDLMQNRLGEDRARQFHSHFSKIEYTEKGGEKRHLTFADTMYGPEFEPLGELIAKRGWTPTFICESAGTQTEDAQSMKLQYEQYKEV